MKYFLMLCFFWGLMHTGFAQTEAAIFTGKWKGTLQWLRPGKPAQSFTMRLTVYPLDSVGQYNFTIQYGDSATDNRPYILKPIDAAKGQWVIDEGNGIVLQNYLVDSCLQGAFTVMGNTIVNNYCIEHGRLRVSFFTIQLNPAQQSGLGTQASPRVDSYAMSGYQYGILNKLE